MVTKSKKNNKTGLWVFFSFTLLAIMVVLLLEYIDYRKGKPSVLFSTVKSTKKAVAADAKVIFKDLNWGKIFSDDADLLDRFNDLEKIEHFNLRINEAKLDTFRQRLRKGINEWGGVLTLVEVNKGVSGKVFLFHVFKNHIKTHILLINVPLSTETPGINQERPMINKQAQTNRLVAIVIDDIGSRANVVARLKKLNIPLTVSILTDDAYAKQEVDALRGSPFEAMIHLPMEPLNGGASISHQVIGPDSTLDEIRTIVKLSRQVVPLAHGANNHQGSLLTSDEGAMRKVLSVFLEEGLFFVDSRTTTDSLAYGLAREMGVKTTFKDLFIDHIPTLEHSRQQMLRLKELLIKKQSVLIIGHPHESTLQVLSETIPGLIKMGVKFVCVSNLLQ